MIDLISYVGDMELASNISKKFDFLYSNTGFIEWDSIFIRLSTIMLSDFTNVAEFANNIKQNFTHLKEIITIDVPNWINIT